MNDSRGPRPGAEHTRRLIAAGAGRLTPVQEAWAAYVAHSLRRCDTCRAADGKPCDTAEELYRAFRHLALTGMGDVWRA